jgi:hypothetical protein
VVARTGRKPHAALTFRSRNTGSPRLRGVSAANNPLSPGAVHEMTPDALFRRPAGAPRTPPDPKMCMCHLQGAARHTQLISLCQSSPSANSLSILGCVCVCVSELSALLSSLFSRQHDAPSGRPFNWFWTLIAPGPSPTANCLDLKTMDFPAEWAPKPRQ